MKKIFLLYFTLCLPILVLGNKSKTLLGRSPARQRYDEHMLSWLQADKIQRRDAPGDRPRNSPARKTALKHGKSDILGATKETHALVGGACDREDLPPVAVPRHSRKRQLDRGNALESDGYAYSVYNNNGSVSPARRVSPAGNVSRRSRDSVASVVFGWK